MKSCSFFAKHIYYYNVLPLNVICLCVYVSYAIVWNCYELYCIRKYLILWLRTDEKKKRKKKKKKHNKLRRSISCVDYL